MADYSKKTQGDNAHLANLTSARFVHIDGNTNPVPVRTGAGRLLRIIVNTKGLAFIVENGSEVIANFATTSVEGDYQYGVYCDSGIAVSSISGSGSATIVYGV